MHVGQEELRRVVVAIHPAPPVPPWRIGAMALRFDSTQRRSDKRHWRDGRLYPPAPGH